MAGPREIAVRDPLTEVTRNERRMLLGVSIIGISLVKTGLVPSKISALGIEFSQTDQKSLLGILALVTAYFVAAFAIYAVADFIAWRLAFVAALDEMLSDVDAEQKRERERELERAQRKFATFADEEKALRQEDHHRAVLRQIRELRVRSSRLPFLLSTPTSFFRGLFEFLLPIIVGIYAVITLWLAPVPASDARRSASPPATIQAPLSLDSKDPIFLFNIH